MISFFFSLQRITDVLLPQSRPRYGMVDDATPEGSDVGGDTFDEGQADTPAERFLFIVCGADADEEKATAFARLLGSSLRLEGVPVSLGFKPTENTKDDE